MLQVEAVDSSTLELLKKLMRIEEFSGLRLVGGTALALRYGHRMSIDLDLFGKINVDEYELINLLKTAGNVKQLNITTNIKSFLINEIKVDLVNYPYEWISPCEIEDKIRIAGNDDIAPMKLSAITGRGSRKDFIDIYFLLEKYSLSDLIKLYNQKYPDGSEFLVLRSLNYFKDADQDIMPTMIINVDWIQVKNRIKQEVQSYLNL
jgi:hypothetical protein